MEEEEDRISHLPEEILVSVLSRLEIEQQARTSVLARRWMKLWRYSTKLRFVFADESNDLLFQGKLFYFFKCKRFVVHVTDILEMHLGSSIEEFTLVFFLNETSFNQDIDGWLKWSLQKSVKRLNFDLISFGEAPNFYSLTTEALCNERVDSLTSVRLHFVDAAGDFLEYLLSACPFLEELSVSESTTLVNFTVTGQSLKLKHLEVMWCSELKHLYIYNVNLVFLSYIGCPSCVAIKDTPSLVKAELSELFVDDEKRNDVQILSHLPLLETLIVKPSIYWNITCFPKLPILRHLKHLELVLEPKNFCLLSCARLLEASPLLIYLKVAFQFFDDSNEEKTVQRLEHQHTSLKVVKLIGFTGCRLELAIATFIIENVAALEKIIIDTRHPDSCYTIHPIQRDAARTLAREQLLVRLPLGVKQIVI